MAKTDFILLPLLAATLAGCTTVGPDHVPPATNVPAAWQGLDATVTTSATSITTTPLTEWWSQFNDPTLTGLIQQALLRSPDVRTAQARLRESRARLGVSEAGFLPTVTAAASASRGKGSQETGSGATRNLYRAGFDARWEVDLFGATRRGVEATRADLEATQADLHATQASLAAEVALNYVDLRSSQARLEIARANLASQSDTLQLTRWRAQAGLASELDVERARGNAAQTRAQLPTLEISLAEAENRLAILLGQPPGSLHAQLVSHAAIPATTRSVAIGIPAEVLRQRPDVQAAERRLAAETARTGVAEAARFPSFTLSGALGLESLTLGTLTASDAVGHSVLASLAATVFDGGRLRQQVAIQNAVQERALVAYEGTVLAALEDVENALVSLSRQEQKLTAQHEAAVAARNAAQLAHQRYAAGLIDFQTVLDTERTQLAAEDSVKITEAGRATALIQLYKALGGGWTAPGNASDRNAP